MLKSFRNAATTQSRATGVAGLPRGEVGREAESSSKSLAYLFLPAVEKCNAPLDLPRKCRFSCKTSVSRPRHTSQTFRRAPAGIDV